MFVATVVLWLGRKRYILVPPAAPNPHSFVGVARTALVSGRPGLAHAMMVLRVPL
jgi:POT family proton-dependent oligopeptide transporter